MYVSTIREIALFHGGNRTGKTMKTEEPSHSRINVFKISRFLFPQGKITTTTH